MEVTKLALSCRALQVDLRCLRLMACRVAGAVFFAGAFPAIAASDETPMDVGIVQLLGAPEKFDGRLVRVVGFLSLEFEGVGLYLHREDFQNGTGNALWINPPDKTDPDLGRHYVEVVGTFEAKAGGHMGFFSAGIKNVTKLTEIAAMWKDIKSVSDCAISSAELSPTERKLVGSWELKVSGERRIDTFEPDRTHWIVSVGPLGEITLLESSRWRIKDGYLDVCDIHRVTSDECLGPRRYGIRIGDIGANTFGLADGTLTFTKCKRPTKPSKSDLVRCR